MTQAVKRKVIEVGRKRIPLRKLFHGKEIRDAAAALEEFRLKLNEEEFMYGAKLVITMSQYGEATLVAKRPETDSEYNSRVEELRVAAEAKKVREENAKLKAAAKAVEDAANRKAKTIEHLKSLAKSNGLTAEDLKSMLEE